MHNDTLDEEVTNYLDKVANKIENPLRKSVEIEMMNQRSHSDDEQRQDFEEQNNFIDDLGFESD